MDASGCLVGLKKQSVSVWVWQESVLRRESHQTSDHRGIRLLFVHRQRNYRGDIIACVGALWVQSGHIRREGGAGPSFCLAIISLIKFWKPTLPTNQQLPVPCGLGESELSGICFRFPSDLTLVRSGGLPVCANLRTSAARCMESRISSWQITMRSRKCIHQWLG